MLRAASTAPSGAHQQPWTFCVVSSSSLKKEKISFESRMSDEWLEDLKPLGTDWQKPYLEIASYIIVVFKQSFGYTADR